MKEFDIEVAPYTFHIIDNYSMEGYKIISRNFKIGGIDCVNVSVTYDDNKNPIDAKIQTLMYDPECSKKRQLDRGKGSVLIIKTLLQYIHNEIPSITLFEFQDASNIECGTEIEQKSKKHRKRGTHAYPVALYYFSLVFNGITWYEKHFNAYQKEGHEAYRVYINEWLTNEKPSFIEFRRKAKPSDEIVDELRTYYDSTQTYKTFFQSIPERDRCRLLRGWIYTFMNEELKGVFSDKWIIDVTKMDNQIKEGKRGTRKKKIYYCPKKRVGHLLGGYDAGAEIP